MKTREHFEALYTANRTKLGEIVSMRRHRAIQRAERAAAVAAYGLQPESTLNGDRYAATTGELWRWVEERKAGVELPYGVAWERLAS
jgi:hypothetical protein